MTRADTIIMCLFGRRAAGIPSSRSEDISRILLVTLCVIVKRERVKYCS